MVWYKSLLCFFGRRVVVSGMVRGGACGFRPASENGDEGMQTLSQALRVCTYIYTCFQGVLSARKFLCPVPNLPVLRPPPTK